MSLSQWLPVAGVLFAGYFAQHVRKQSAEQARRRLQGLAHVRSLRRLLQDLPAHRGMANTWLQGDESFRDKLTALGRQIDNHLTQIDAIVAGDPWNAAERATRIQSQWADIKHELRQLQPAASFERHTALITEVLYLMNDTAQAAGLLNHPDATTARLADAAVNQLPLVTEMLGQARGLGAGVAARGKCGTDMRVKLNYLLQKARSVVSEVTEVMTKVLAADVTINAKDALAESQTAQARFLDLLDRSIISSRDIDIPSGEYFAAGTQAIERSFALLDTLVSAMQDRLEGEVSASGRRLLLARVGATSVALVLLGYVAV